LQWQKLGGVSGSQQCSENIWWNWRNRPATCFKKTVSLNLAEFEQFWVDGLELLAQTNPALILSSQAVFLILQGYMFVLTVPWGSTSQWIEWEPQQSAPGFSVIQAKWRARHFQRERPIEKVLETDV
jgi:hypothetical protein